ncbi:hypothetical protein DNU06_02625 [Putridiphycobacter roseus]|uniref:UspA domain-containing protein n=1 Tax=Putridiphycobacter roseus TaxID=2219161 RepID=A0A2W1NSW9_9FLAO|nr:universal stress protein [Putridiphycobacter roseus]PZE18742.1 hypothetical protein DNU06_02625 [Putridiphycobacter roseus]
MKQVIVPTNFSKTAWNATMHAIEYCKILDAELVLLHAFENYPNGLNTSALSVSETMESKEDEMELLVTKLMQCKESTIKIKALCIGGSLFEYINALNATSVSNLIVMGTQGRSGMGGKFFGSNVSRLMHVTHSTILVVPSNAAFSLSNTICCAIDNGSEIKAGDLNMMEQIVQAGHQQIINIIHVLKNFKKPNKILPISQFQKIKLLYKEIEGDNVPTTLELYTNHHKSSLLVLVRKKRSFFENIFQESVSTSLTFKASIPILVLRSK